MSLKTLRENLCRGRTDDLPADVNDALARLIALIDLHRPLGHDGTHGDWHTPTCGCRVKRGGRG